MTEDQNGELRTNGDKDSPLIRLDIQVHFLKNQLAAQEEYYRLSINENRLLTSQIIALQSDISRLRIEISKLETGSQQKNNLIELRDKEIKKQKLALADFKKHVEKLNAKVKKLDSQIGARDNEIQKLKIHSANKDRQIIDFWNKIQKIRLSNRVKALLKKQKVGFTISDLNIKQDLEFDLKSTISDRWSITVIVPRERSAAYLLLTVANLLSSRGHHVNIMGKPDDNLAIIGSNLASNSFSFADVTVSKLEECLPNADLLITYIDRMTNLINQVSSRKGLKIGVATQIDSINSALGNDGRSVFSNFTLLSSGDGLSKKIKAITGRHPEILKLPARNDCFYPTVNIKNTFRIGGVHFTDESKRSADIIAAYMLLRKEYPGLQLVMYGQEENPGLQKEIEYHHNPKPEELRALYSSCYAWVEPRLNGVGAESITLSMLTKTPVVIASAIDIADIYNDSNAILIPENSPDKIAEAITWLITNPTEAKRLAETAYSDITTPSWTNFVDGLEKIFEHKILEFNPSGFRSLNYDLTIGIPIHNELHYLKKCINSIKKHTTSNYELILVDDCSGDETRSYLQDIQGDDCKCIRNSERKGFPYNCNEIARNARGKYICLLNSDTVVTENWDKYLIDVLKVNPTLGMVGPSTSYGVAKNYDSIAQQLEEVHFKRFEMTQMDIEAFAKDLFGKTYPSIERTEYLNGFCMMVDRQVFSKIGFFDTRFGLGSREEVQFIDRMKYVGLEVGWVKYAYVHHFGHRSFSNYKDSQHLWQTNKELYQRTKGQDVRIGISQKRIGWIYNRKDSASTRKRTFEVHKYLKEYLDIELKHWAEVTVDFLEQMDIIVLQRIGGLGERIGSNFSKVINSFIEKELANPSGKKIFYDTDDYVFKGLDTLPRKLIENVTGVIVTTPTLADLVRPINNNVFILPNGVDSLRISRLSSNNESPGIRIVAFTLAGAGLKSLAHLGERLANCQINFTIDFFSGQTHDHTSFPFLNIRKNVGLDQLFFEMKSADYAINWGEHDDEYFDTLNSLYGIDKNEELKFIDSKSGLKYYNAALTDCVFVSSRVPVVYSSLITSGRNGFLVDRIEDVVEIIMELENNPQKKREILLNARVDVTANYTMESVCRDYLNFFASA